MSSASKVDSAVSLPSESVKSPRATFFAWMGACFSRSAAICEVSFARSTSFACAAAPVSMAAKTAVHRMSIKRRYYKNFWTGF